MVDASEHSVAAGLLAEIAEALAPSGVETPLSRVAIEGEGALASAFAVSDLAAASIAAAGAALAAYADGAAAAPIRVDRRLASFWFSKSLRAIGWAAPPVWDPISANYRAKDGWIRIHANARSHRDRALTVLGGAGLAAAPDAGEAARRVAAWEAEALESAIVAAGGCAARMRSVADWAASAEGAAVAAEPLIVWRAHPAVAPTPAAAPGAAPLAGVRVLDLTRVLAGPASTRCLAGFGAEVLRIDPEGWEDRGAVPEMTLGKRCAHLDLRVAADRSRFETLIAGADLLTHGYRPAALARLGYDAAALRRLNPRLVDVSLDAYGWSGPWAERRGFDSLVQMSSGLAAAGMAWAGADRPTPLPVQALDHATGYLMAAAALTALSARRRSGAVLSARLSLARTAALLARTPAPTGASPAAFAPETEADLAPEREETAWGPARRLRFPLRLGERTARWPLPAGPLRAAAPQWRL